MERGFGWWYPAGADNADAPWNQKEHSHLCPMSDDWVCEDCRVEDLEPCKHSGSECICAELERQAKAEAAEHRRDCRNDD